MGRDKAALILDGQSMLEIVAGAVAPLVSQIVVMLSPSQSLPPVSEPLAARIDVGRDTRPDRGPLQGIIDALPLLRPQIQALFILSCDLPFLTTAALHSMLSLLEVEKDGVCAVVQGRINPLLALYRRRHVSKAVNRATAGRSCMVLVDSRRVIHLPPPVGAPHLFNGMNTPDDLEAIQRQLVAGRR